MTTPEKLQRELRSLNDEALDQLFRAARSYSFYLPRPVEEATLR